MKIKANPMTILWIRIIEDTFMKYGTISSHGKEMWETFEVLAKKSKGKN